MIRARSTVPAARVDRGRLHVVRRRRAAGGAARVRGAAATLAFAVAALGSAASAGAAPVSGTAKIHVVGTSPSRPQLKTISTVVDPATGEWESRVTFTERPTAADASDLYVGLKPTSNRVPTARWAMNTDPATVGGPRGTDPSLLFSRFNDGYLPTPGATASYDGDSATLVLRVTDASVRGADPDTVVVSLYEPNSDVGTSSGTVFLGPTAPISRFPARAARLRLRRDGTVRIPLFALDRPASRRVTLYIGGTRSLKLLPEKYYRRDSIVVRLDRTAMKRIERGATVKMALRTSLGNQSTTTTSRTITIRR